VVATAGQDVVQSNYYDRDGHLTYSVDGMGDVTHRVYDADGNVIDSIAYATRITPTTWSSPPALGSAPAVTAVPAQDHEVRTVFDALNRPAWILASTANGTWSVTANLYDNKGNLYFTDPPYGLEGKNDDPKKELKFNGVYLLRKSGELVLLTKELTFPNGLAFSPDEKTLYVAQSDPKKATLVIGNNEWPFPIPIVQEGSIWYFDSAAGAEEVINRRIGENELATIQSCLAYVDAQQEYYLRNVQKDPLQHFANKLISTPGKKDGLYWPAAENEPQSPLGEEFAAARAEGYLQPGSPKGAPFHGYVYRLLESQGPNSPGGAYDYVAHGEMFGGFGLIAFPAEYGSSGVMTFIVNQDGVVYSRDLGPNTQRVAMGIVEFNPDSMWTKEDGANTLAGN